MFIIEESTVRIMSLYKRRGNPVVLLILWDRLSTQHGLCVPASEITGSQWLLRGNGGFVDMRNGNTRGNHLAKTTNLLRAHGGRCVVTDEVKSDKIATLVQFCGPLTHCTDGDGSCRLQSRCSAWCRQTQCPLIGSDPSYDTMF